MEERRQVTEDELDAKARDLIGTINVVLFIKEVREALEYEPRAKRVRFQVDRSAQTNRIPTEQRERIFRRLQYEHEVNIDLHIP